MNFIAATVFVGSVPIGCPILTVSWFSDANCTTPMKNPPTQGADFDFATMVLTDWNYRLHSCHGSTDGLTSTGIVCDGLGYTFA